MKNSANPGSATCAGFSAPYGSSSGSDRSTGSPPPVMPVPAGPCGSRCPRRRGRARGRRDPSAAARSGRGARRARRGPRRSGRRRSARTRPPAPSSTTPAGGARPATSTSGLSPSMLQTRAIHGPGATTTVSHSSRPSLVAIAATPSSPRSKPTTSTPSRISDAGAARPVGEVAHGLHRVRPAAAALVQHRLDRRVPVGPRPRQVLAAALGADHELGRVARPLVLLADGHQVVHLALRAPPRGSRPGGSRRRRALTRRSRPTSRPAR